MHLDDWWPSWLSVSQPSPTKSPREARTPVAAWPLFERVTKRVQLVERQLMPKASNLGGRGDGRMDRPLEIHHRLDRHLTVAGKREVTLFQILHRRLEQFCGIGDALVHFHRAARDVG